MGNEYVKNGIKEDKGRLANINVVMEVTESEDLKAEYHQIKYAREIPCQNTEWTGKSYCRSSNIGLLIIVCGERTTANTE